MKKLSIIIDSFLVVSIILEIIGFFTTVFLIKNATVDIVTSIIPFIVISIVSIILLIIYFNKRISALSLIRKHISDKAFYIDIFVVIFFIINLIISSIYISIMTKLVIENITFIICNSFISILYLINILLFFWSTFIINKEIRDRRDRKG